MSLNQLLINAIAFNIAWLGCVLMGNIFIPIVLAWCIIHLLTNESRNAEILLVSSVTIIGSAIDSVLTHLGVFVFQGQSLLIPLWLTFIWLSFALTINGCLAFLRISVGLQLLAGMVLVPLSYVAGSAFGAVKFGYSTGITFIILSIIWLLLMPFFYFLNQFIRSKCHVQKG